MTASTGKSILMLEDDTDRIDSFSEVLHKNAHGSLLLHWCTAPTFIRGYLDRKEEPQLIALDHDLIADTVDAPDPGDGRDVAEFLATQAPCCPILIHSTNTPCAQSMELTLRDNGWQVSRLMPMGDDRIQEFWWPQAKDILPVL
tara:strand:- start:1 stop:432 length:432 start_codon:yes stop_codon:yes gene_type:complete